MSRIARKEPRLAVNSIKDAYALQSYTTITRTQAVIVGHEDDGHGVRSDKVLMDHARSSKVESCAPNPLKIGHLAL